MAILLDSASLDDAAAAARLGFVSGITTNPALMARETKEPLAHLARLQHQGEGRGLALVLAHGPPPDRLNIFLKTSPNLWKTWRPSALLFMAQIRALGNSFPLAAALFAWHRKGFRVGEEGMQEDQIPSCEPEKFLLVFPQIG